MGSQLKIYDADQMSIGICAIPVNDGWADGEFVTIDWETDAFSDVVGTSGEVTRSKTLDRRATITLKLMQTAEANAKLAALALLDRNAPNGAGVGPMIIADRQGLSLYTAAQCWIQQTPNPKFDREAGPREWKIRVAVLEDFTGGN